MRAGCASVGATLARSVGKARPRSRLHNQIFCKTLRVQSYCTHFEFLRCVEIDAGVADLANSAQ
jgi:hypothetical protein